MYSKASTLACIASSMPLQHHEIRQCITCLGPATGSGDTQDAVQRVFKSSIALSSSFTTSAYVRRRGYDAAR